MSKKNIISFSFVMFVIGVMLALYFQSNQEPAIRETRDMWEIRLQLQTEQNNQQLLQNELNDLKSIQTQYESASEQEQIKALNESIALLEQKSGLTAIHEPGLQIELIPYYDEQSDDLSFPELTPELLSRLINELNAYGAKHIAINNERLTQMTAVRFVNEQIHMNQRPLPDLPITVKVTSDDADRLLSYMEVSQSHDEFAMQNIFLKLEKVNDVDIPAYEGHFNLQHVKVIEEDKAGES